MKQNINFLISKQKSTGSKHFNDFNTFVEYSYDMDDINKNIEEYNPNKKRKILIVFDDMIADMLNNKKTYPIVTELLIRGRKLNMLFIRGRKLNISFALITQPYFAVPTNIRLNSMHYFIMKVPNIRELQQIVFNH